jgi:osmotically-inducible protein OsmY
MRGVTRYAMLTVCVVLLVAIVSCAGSRESRSTGEYIDDSAIATKVKAALHGDPDVSGFQIEVEVFKGVVQLSGFVDSAAQKQQAEQIAQSVDGVKEVKNSLIVK